MSNTTAFSVNTIVNGDSDINNLSVNTLTSHIIPSEDAAVDLGSATKRFRELHVAPGTIYLGDCKLEEVDGELATRRKVGGEWQAKKYPNNSINIVTNFLIDQAS